MNLTPYARMLLMKAEARKLLDKPPPVKVVHEVHVKETPGFPAAKGTNFLEIQRKEHGIGL